MLVEYINIKRRHTLHASEFSSLHLPANYLALLEAPPPGRAWLVRHVLTCQAAEPAISVVSGGSFRICYEGSTVNIITPVDASDITGSARCFALLPHSHQLQFNAAVQLSASSELTTPLDDLEILVIADLVRQ